MRDWFKRIEPGLKILCLLLAIGVLCELGGIVLRWNPFRGVKVPDLPVLTSSTNHPAGPSPGAAPMAMAQAAGTNVPGRPAATNLATHPPAGLSNAVPPATAIVSTNGGTNVAAAGNAGTNARPTVSILATNIPGGTNIANTTNGVSATNAIANSSSNPPTQRPPMPGGMAMHGGMPRPGMPMVAGMNFGMFPGGKPGGDLPPALKARIDRIVDSEILGPVMRPLPMALLGIAGDEAFLRSANGQTGLVKEGDSLDDIKLLRIGINRVLIEQGGQKKELTIFSGYGGESLLPNDSSNENPHL